MIKPVRKNRKVWHLRWFDINLPLVAPNGTYFMPSIAIIVDESKNDQTGGTHVAPCIVQNQVEDFLADALDAQDTPPDIVHIDANPEWDMDAWSDFSREYHIEIRIAESRNALAADQMKRLIDGLCQRFTVPTDATAQIAAGLVQCALNMPSSRKAQSLFQQALHLDPQCAAAHVEIADTAIHEQNWSTAMEHYDTIISDFERAEDGRLKAGVGEVSDLAANRPADESQDDAEPSAREKSLQPSAFSPQPFPDWWTDRATRPYLRALYGRAMAQWHMGHYIEATRSLEKVVNIHPVDNLGARFHIPLLYMLADEWEEAEAAFRSYEKRYPSDTPMPAFHYAAALCAWYFGDDDKARELYRQGISTNFHIAYELLNETVYYKNLWYPDNTADDIYADEFMSSFGVLWDREAASLRVLREVLRGADSALYDLLKHREKMLDFRDQRYDPDFKKHWRDLEDRDAELVKLISNGS